MRALLAILLACALAGPVFAQGRAGPGPAPGPWQQAYPDIYYNYGGIRLPFTVPGGSKGPGTINAAGFYINGVSVTSVPVSAANMPAFSGDCSSSAGTTVLTCTKTQGTPFASSATTDTTNANNIGSGVLPAARLPAPAAATRGGVFSATAPSNQFQTGIDTTGAPLFAQPAFVNISGVLLAAQVPAFTGDFTCSGLTCSLATVNASPSSYGGASSVPTFTVNGKGLLTAAGATAVVAPAGTLSGTTLASSVVNTSITKVGTIATGVWNGTAVDPAYIVTGTSGAAIGLLNASKTDSGSNTYSGSNTWSGTALFTNSNGVNFNGPSTTIAGYANFNTSDGVRRLYVGFGDGASNVVIQTDNGWGLKIVSPQLTGTVNGAGATSFTVPTVATGTGGTAAASAGLVDSKIAAAVAAAAPNIFSFTNLKVTPGGTPASQATVTADRIILQGASTGLMRSGVNVTCNTGSTGANGLDSGAVAASTWYAVYVIDNGTAPACLLSTSGTAPTLPSGYTYSARVGWQRTNGSSQLIGIVQYNRSAQYVVDGSRLAALPQIFNGASNGSVSTPTYVSISVAASVPTTASAIDCIVYSFTNANGIAIMAPSTTFGAYNSTSNPPPITVQSGAANIVVGMRGFLRFQTAQTVYAASQSATVAVTNGWEDNL